METDTPNTQVLRNAATSAAMRRIRDAHKDEYLVYLKEEADLRGVTIQVRKTETEKAEEALAKLLNQHPELKEKLAEEIANAKPF